MPLRNNIQDSFILLENRLKKSKWLAEYNRSSIKNIMDLFKEGGISEDDMISEFDTDQEHLKSSMDNVHKLRQKICDKIRDLPIFKNDSRFSNMTQNDASKLERFYESVLEHMRFNPSGMQIDFEDACKLAVNHYDDITELYGDVWHESFTESQKLSSIFVNSTLESLDIRDCKTGDNIKIDENNLKVCSYSSADADVVCDAMMGIAENEVLNIFHGLITVNQDTMREVVNVAQKRFSDNPELGTFLNKQDVEEVSNEIFLHLYGLDAGVASDVVNFAYERTAVASTSYGNMMCEVKKGASDMFQELALPITSHSQFSYELEGEKCWVTDTGKSYTESEMQDRYDTQITNTEFEINVLP